MYKNSDEPLFCRRHLALSVETREELKARSLTVLKFFNPDEERGTEWGLRLLGLYKKEVVVLAKAAKVINVRVNIPPSVLPPRHFRSYRSALRPALQIKAFFDDRSASIRDGLKLRKRQKERFEEARNAFEAIRLSLFKPETSYSLEELIERVG